MKSFVLVLLVTVVLIDTATAQGAGDSIYGGRHS